MCPACIHTSSSTTRATAGRCSRSRTSSVTGCTATRRTACLFNASTPLTTAETASVFAEALTFKRLLADEQDARRRLNLAGRIEDSIATVFRQIAMNRFEDAAHTSRRDDGEPSPERFEEPWARLADGHVRRLGRRRRVRDVVELHPALHRDARLRLRVLVAGFLFALSVFRKYELEGDAMAEPYLDVLRAGGSKPPGELAQMVGLDLTDPKIWEAGIDALAVELDEAEALAADIGLWRSVLTPAHTGRFSV